jgi:hypothetical protein
MRRRASLLAVGSRYTILHEERQPLLDPKGFKGSLCDAAPNQYHEIRGPTSLTTFTWEEICERWNHQFRDSDELANFRPLRWDSVNIRQLTEIKDGHWVWTPNAGDYRLNCKELIVPGGMTREDFAHRQTAWKAWLRKLEFSSITPMEF